VKAITDSVNEIDPKFKSAWILTLRTSLFHVDILGFKSEHISFVLRNKTGDFTSSEHRVYGLKEALTLNFGVSHDECDLLSEGTSLSVEVLNVVLKLRLTIGLSKSNLEEDLLTNERSELGK
jgi:hypothetical protein